MVKERTAKNWFNFVLLSAGAASGVMGLVVLVSSYTHSIRLLEVLQVFSPMPYNAALGFILCGTGLLSIALGRPRLALAAGLAAAIGLLFLYYGIEQPGPELLVESQMPFYETSVTVGLLMALLLALALHYAQMAWLRAKEAESVNRELQKQIAERKQAEEALKASQDYARNIIDSSLDMIVAVDKDRKIVEFNKAAQETFGYRPEEVLGKHVDILYADACQGLKINKKALEQGQRVDEIFNKRKSGEIFPCFLSASVLRDTQGELIGVMGISRDVSERKRAEETLQVNMKRLRALQEVETAVGSTLELDKVLNLLLEKIGLHLSYSAVTICLVNRDTGHLEQTAYRNFGARYREADGWKPACALPSESLNVKTPTVVIDLQADPRMRDRESFHKHGLVSYLGIPLVAKGEFLGVLGFYTGEKCQFPNDEIEFLMTVAGQGAIAIQNSQLYDEMKNLAGELARSNRVKDEFLSVMSHELRTPLNVVMGYTGMVRDGMFGEVNADQSKALEKVISRANDQLTMISSILEATRMEVERVKIEEQEFSLREFLDDLKSGYEIPLDKQITVDWECPSDLPVVRTDKRKLGHILQNLVNNAIKFTEKGSVSISAWYYPLAKAVEFKVADTGIGIPKESQSAIFEIFRQVDSSETRAHGGVGLGLYIAKKFTELLAGKIWVDSKPGRGSTFYVRLPLEARPPQQKLKAA